MNLSTVNNQLKFVQKEKEKETFVKMDRRAEMGEGPGEEQGYSGMHTPVKKPVQRTQ